MLFYADDQMLARLTDSANYIMNSAGYQMSARLTDIARITP